MRTGTTVSLTGMSTAGLVWEGGVFLVQVVVQGQVLGRPSCPVCDSAAGW